MRRAVLLGVAVLVATACGGGDPETATGPSALTVPVLDVVVTGEVATLLANVEAPDGSLATVLVEWGDGTSDTVTSGFPGVRLDHTYTTDGDFTIVLEARDTAGQSVIATTVASIDAFAASAAASPDDSDGGSGGDGSDTGGSSRSGGTGRGSTQPSPSPEPEPEPEPEGPAPDPIPEPEPEPEGPAPDPIPEPEPEPEGPAPDPIPEPVTLNLRDAEVVISLDNSDPDGAGGSAEALRQGPYAFGLRSYAWHGYNGSGRAEGSLWRVVDATSVLADMPEQVTAVTAEVSYEIDVTAELKGPSDRYSDFDVTVTLPPFGGRVVSNARARNDAANPIRRVSEVGSTGTITATLTRDSPTVTFYAEGSCASSSGSQAVALLHEGYCDALEKGGITLRALTVTYTPIVED